MHDNAHTAHGARSAPLNIAPGVAQTAWAIGVVALALAAWLGTGAHDGYRRLLHAYLLAWAYFLSIALGALFFVTLQHLTRAGWSVVVRRVAENLAAVLPLMAALFVPVIVSMLMGNSALYPWVDTAVVAADPLLRGKSAYLNVPFFVVRFALYGIIWTVMSQFWLRQSWRQDAIGDWNITHQNQKVAAPGMALFALSATFCAFDTMMSLEPHWFSTMYGVYFFAGCAMSFLATTILILRFLQGRGLLLREVTTEHFHDLGKLLFGFVFFWGYIAFSQYMLIWYANIPEETEWLIERDEHGWRVVSLALLIGHFALPFPGLLSRHVKRHPIALPCWAAFLLIMQWIDLYWLIMPSMGHAGPPFGLIDVAAWVGIGSMFLARFVTTMRGRQLVPVQDPRLAESLAFENA